MKERNTPTIEEFEVRDETGGPITYLPNWDDVLEYANDNQDNPGLDFVAVDTSGYQAGIWSIDEVLAGRGPDD